MKLNPVFDKYFDEEQAVYYEQLFLIADLHPFVDKPKSNYDAAIGNRNNDLQFVLRLPVEEFGPAMDVIEREVRKAGIPYDYPLRNLSVSELQEILVNTDEWSRPDSIAAKILLEEDHVPVNYEQIEKVKSLVKRTRKKREGSIPPIVLILLYASALLGGFIAIIGGALINLSKSTDLDGKTDYTFTEEYRRHGKITSILGAIIALLFILTKIMFSR